MKNLKNYFFINKKTAFNLAVFFNCLFVHSCNGCDPLVENSDPKTSKPNTEDSLTPEQLEQRKTFAKSIFQKAQNLKALISSIISCVKTYYSTVPEFMQAIRELELLQDPDLNNILIFSKIDLDDPHLPHNKYYKKDELNKLKSYKFVQNCEGECVRIDGYINHINYIEKLKSNTQSEQSSELIGYLNDFKSQLKSLADEIKQFHASEIGRSI